MHVLAMWVLMREACFPQHLAPWGPSTSSPVAELVGVAGRWSHAVGPYLDAHHVSTTGHLAHLWELVFPVLKHSLVHVMYVGTESYSFVSITSLPAWGSKSTFLCSQCLEEYFTDLSPAAHGVFPNLSTYRFSGQRASCSTHTVSLYKNSQFIHITFEVSLPLLRC